MDEDNKIIEELRSNSEYQRTQILQLEKALKQEMAKRGEINRSKSEELHKLNELIHALKEKVATCMSTIDAKNVELLNLQTALGQYYAETEAKVIENTPVSLSSIFFFFLNGIVVFGSLS